MSIYHYLSFRVNIFWDYRFTMLQLMHLLSDLSSKFQPSMAIFHHKFVEMQILPKLVSETGIWMNKKLVGMTILVNFS